MVTPKKKNGRALHRLKNEIFAADPIWGNSGTRTRTLLKAQGIKSPSITGMIQVDKKTWVVPKEKLHTDEQKLEYIDNVKAIYNGK